MPVNLAKFTNIACNANIPLSRVSAITLLGLSSFFSCFTRDTIFGMLMFVAFSEVSTSLSALLTN